MKRTKQIFIHILPVLIGVIITVLLSYMVYDQMMTNEENNSWEQLDNVASSVAEKMNIRFRDNINLMERVADAISLKGSTGQLDTVLEYLNQVQKSTIFERVDILMPDNTIVHQNGEIHAIQETDVPYAQIAAQGSHYSFRYTDWDTGKEVIACAVPIVTDGKTEAVLIGIVDCLQLADQFKTYSFGGTARIFLVDQRDGNYLMDSGMGYLGNIDQVEKRQRLKGFEDVDHHQEMIQGLAGRVAFISQANGLASYMSYMPVEGFPWSVAVMAQEDQVLENVFELSQTLMKIAALEGLLLLSYVGWNLFVGNTLVKQRENVRKMEQETETNQAKSVFLSSVSHDIRTPLNGILGMLDVIDRRRNVPAELEGDLEKIRLSAEYLVSLADNVLDLNDLESGKGLVEEDHIDLRKLGPELEVIIQSKLRDSSVSFHLEEPQLAHPYVLGSDGYLHRIMTNLIGNAVKYNKEKGSIWVKVEEAEIGDGESLYRFTVKDNGIGMSEEFQNRLFHAFEQEQAGARSKNTGHGLGLAIVDRMVKRMGGSITVESTKNLGSTFSVTIPFRWDLTGEAAQAQEQTVSDLSGTRILLVEDNELNMEIATLLLEDIGAQITSAVHGRQAVELFEASEEYHFDVVLMDVMMPEMDGCEATRIIRKMARQDAKLVPIIAMTASTFAEDIQRCREAGMNDHIGKPLNIEVLFALVAKYRNSYGGVKRAAGRSESHG